MLGKIRKVGSFAVLSKFGFLELLAGIGGRS